MIYTNISGPSQYDGEGAKGWQGFTRIEKKRCIHAQLPVGLITFVDHVKTWSGSLKQGLSGFVCTIQIDDLGHGDGRPENYTMRIRVQSRDTNNNLYTSSAKCSSNVENQCKLSYLISSRDRKETLVSWYIYIPRDSKGWKFPTGLFFYDFKTVSKRSLFILAEVIKRSRLKKNWSRLLPLTILNQSLTTPATTCTHTHHRRPQDDF